MNKIFYLSFIICLSFKTIAQVKLSMPNTSNVSPTAASLSKYADTPVSLHTGIANISIPFYQINVRDASVAVGLGYHSGGIKVDEEAGIVGLGWSLQAGGVISRTIYGSDDYSQHPELVQYFNQGSFPLPPGKTTIQDIPKNALPDKQKSRSKLYREN
ncbi:hypothetical protein [Emticicia sp. 17c]|uniref:hypothetical protein n=1 Tax=Emticicia sp. 17c TaxID=3127704 RepID=UPI00301BB637